MGLQNKNLSEQSLDALSESDMQLIAEQLNAIEPGVGIEAVSNGLLLSDSLLAISAVIVISVATFAIIKMYPTFKKISNKV